MHTSREISLKDLGIIFVVAGHTGSSFTNWFYAFHMALFFFVSGYLRYGKSDKSSWKEFIKNLNSHDKSMVRMLDESPIPPGYFNSLEAKVSSLSGEENIVSYFKNNLHKEDDLVEMLYCTNGCNNGDGVLINE